VQRCVSVGGGGGGGLQGRKVAMRPRGQQTQTNTPTSWSNTRPRRHSSDNPAPACEVWEVGWGVTKSVGQQRGPQEQGTTASMGLQRCCNEPSKVCEVTSAKTLSTKAAKCDG
jgi:hypothetical protein